MNKVLLVYEDYSEMTTIQSVLKKVGFDVMSISSEFSLSQQILAFNPDIVIGYGKGPKVSTVGVGRRLKEMPRWTGRVVLIFPTGPKPDPQDLLRIRMDMAVEAPVDATRILQVLAQLTGQDSRALVGKMMNAVASEAQNTIHGSTSVAGEKDGPMFVSGQRTEAESWSVKGSKEIDEFNRLMGVSSPATEPRTPDRTGSNGPPLAPDSSYVTGGELPSSSREDVSAPRGILEDLQKAGAKVHEKVQGYGKFLTGLVLHGASQLQRSETRRAQKNLKSSWDEKELQNQDVMRRQFTASLFKKKD